MEKLRSAVFDPIRQLCDSQQFQFLVILQNSSCPDQKYWTSSQQLKHFLGDWIAEIATRIETEDKKVFHDDWDEQQGPLSNNGVPQGPPSPTQVVDEDEQLQGTWIEDTADHLTIDALTPMEDTNPLPTISHNTGLPTATSPSSLTQHSIGKKRLRSNGDDDVAMNQVGIGGKRLKLDVNDVGSGARVGCVGDDDRGSGVVHNVNDCVLLMPDGEEIEEEDRVIDDGPETAVEGESAPQSSEQNKLKLQNLRLKRSKELQELVNHPIEKSSEADTVRRVGGSFLHLREGIWNQDRPLREDDPATNYLDDDLERDTCPSPSTLPHCQSDPVVWKKHFFDKPLRPSLVKRLLEDKVFYSHPITRYHVSDAEYAKTCIKILRKRNPYCVFRPKNLCRFLKEKDMFQAEFVCQYDTCQVEAYLFITCGENKVSIEFVEKDKNLKGPFTRPVEKDNHENPFITFAPHKSHDDESSTEQLITALKKNRLTGVLTPDELQAGFVSKLAFDENLKKQVVPSHDCLVLLKPLLAQLNPYCHFEVVSPCVPLTNKNKKKLTPQKFSVHLACSDSNCTILATLNVSNPSGDVLLKFTYRGGKPSHAANPISLETSEDFITLNHQGEVLHVGDFPVVDKGTINENGDGRTGCKDSVDKSSALGSSTDPPENSTYFLKIPSPIMHDEKIPRSVLKEVFLDKLIIGQMPDGSVKERPRLPDSAYLSIIRPIVRKYNPNCTLRGINSKCLYKTRAVKCLLRCKRKDCDFLVDCRVYRDSGEVLLYMRNQLALTCNPYTQAFCYIRHEKDTSLHYIRKPERERLYRLSEDELKQMFGGSRLGEEIRKEARKWRRKQVEMGLNNDENQDTWVKELVKPSDKQKAEEKPRNKSQDAPHDQDNALLDTLYHDAREEHTPVPSQDRLQENDSAFPENADHGSLADRGSQADPDSVVNNGGFTSHELAVMIQDVSPSAIVAIQEPLKVPRTISHHTIPFESLRYFTKLMDQSSAEDAQIDNSADPSLEKLDHPLPTGENVPRPPAYVRLLHLMLAKANPYCQWHPKFQAFYDASTKQYKALFYCVEDSCDIMAWCHVHSVTGKVFLQFWNQSKEDDSISKTAIVLGSDEEDEGEDKSVLVNHPPLKARKKQTFRLSRTATCDSSMTEQITAVAEKPIHLKTYSRRGQKL